MSAETRSEYFPDGGVLSLWPPSQCVLTEKLKQAGQQGLGITTRLDCRAGHKIGNVVFLEMFYNQYCYCYIEQVVASS